MPRAGNGGLQRRPPTCFAAGLTSLPSLRTISPAACLHPAPAAMAEQALQPANRRTASCCAGKHEIVEGESRECVGGHDVICSLFPRLSSPHGGHAPLKMVHVAPCSGPADDQPQQRALRLGVVLSGGQAPGARGRGRLGSGGGPRVLWSQCGRLVLLPSCTLRLPCSWSPHAPTVGPCFRTPRLFPCPHPRQAGTT